MNHSRYCGNLMMAYCATALTAFIVFPVLAIPFILTPWELSFAKVFLSALCLIASVCLFICGQSDTVAMQCYTWYTFKADVVIIQTLFRKKKEVEYANFTDVGVGFYTHGIMNSNVGSKVWFIYLADHKIDSKYKYNMNLLKPSLGCLKVGFSKKTYRYLIEHLPEKQAKMLEISYTDYERFHR